MNILKKSFIALGAVVALVGAALASPVAPAEAASCVDGNSYKDFTGKLLAKDTVTVSTASGGKLCEDVVLNVTSFAVTNPNYNGKPFKSNPTAIPQKMFATKQVVMKKGTAGKVTVTVAVPDECTPYQIDAYIGPAQTDITTSAGLVNTRAIVAKLYDKTKTDCTVKPETVKVCNPTTGEIITVPKTDESKYESVDSVKCEKIKVCVIDSGDTTLKAITKDQFDSSKHSTNPADCDKPETPTTPTTPTTPKAEEPEVLPSTGPVETLSGIVGISAIAGATTAYVRSRRLM